MIDFSIDSDFGVFLDAARRYAREALAPGQRAFEAARSIPADTLAQARAMGLERACWQERHGGSGLDWVGWCTVLSELAQGDAAAAVAIDAPGRAYDALMLAGQDDWVSRFLSPGGDGQAAPHAVLAYDPDGALQGDGAGCFDGTLPWVHADQADLLLVVHPGGVCVLTEGYTLEAVPGLALQGAGASRLRFDKAPVAARRADPALAQAILARTRLRQASAMLGVLEAASSHARAYALERVAFGKPIAHHQALAFLLVDMNSAVEQTRVLIQEAAHRLDVGDAALDACNQAFIQACEAGHFVGPNAVQVLGAAGFMRDYPVEKYMRELTALGLALGGADAARESLCRHVALPQSIDFLLASAEAR